MTRVPLLLLARKATRTTGFAFLFLLMATPATVIAQEERSDLFDPVGLFLTWQQDPATTMTIDWHTENGERKSIVEYRGEGEDEWQSDEAERFPFPYSDRIIHRVELTGLKPDNTYSFRFGENSREFSFRTMPKTASRQIRFATGGDMMHKAEWMEQTGRQAMEYDLDFVLIGGDLSYANGRRDSLSRWYDWFTVYKNSLISPEGRVVPMLVAIGNHEVRGALVTGVVSTYFRDEEYPEDERRLGLAPYYFRLFAFPGQPGYGVLDFGDYMSLFLLDSHHTNEVDLEQAEWLEKALSERQDRPHLFPCYHIPGYPSVRSFDGQVNALIRDTWSPLFEKYGVRLAFENHDHAYKRTVPITAGEPDADGVIYLGDGCWGTGPREIHPADETWYLEKSQSIRHFMVVTIDGDSRSVLAVDEEGNVIDRLEE